MNEGLPSYPTFSLAMEENTYPIDIPSEEEWRNSIMSIFEDNPQHVTVGPEHDIPVSVSHFIIFQLLPKSDFL